MVKYEDDNSIGFLDEHGDIDSLLSSEDQSDDESDYEDVIEVNGIKVPLKHGEMVLGSQKTRQFRKGVNNVDALERALESVQYKVPKGLKRVPWVETLAITSQKTVEEVASTDDVKREGVFQNITMEMVKEGLRRLDALKIPFSRPVDYFADMAKSDKHMKKIQAKLQEEQRRMAIVEERKKNRAEKKVAKEKRVEAVQAKKRAANDSLRELEEWKKNRSRGNQSGESVEEDLDRFLAKKDKAKEDRDFRKMQDKKKQVAATRDSRKEEDFKVKVKAGGGTGRTVFGAGGDKDDKKKKSFGPGKKAKKRGSQTKKSSGKGKKGGNKRK